MSTKASTGFKLSVMTLAIMNVTAVVSLRGLPAEAIYGPSSAFYYLFAAIVFLIPTALVAAELAAMFSDKQGGVFRWVGEAFGPRSGFLAIFLQWIESTIWYPTVLTFGAVAIAFIGMDQTIEIWAREKAEQPFMDPQEFGKALQEVLGGDGINEY